MARQMRATIDLAALRHNLSLAREAAAGARVLAVIKANGYGHGLLQAARAMHAADGFGVSTLEEALPLREAGLVHPVLLLQGALAPADLVAAARYRFDVMVHSEWQLEQLERTRLERPLRVWIKVDTGMHRLGFRPEAVAEAYRRLVDCRNVAPHPRFATHLASADTRGSEATLRQLESFVAACGELPGKRSIANSAALLGWPQARADWVRPGIMLYGANPFVDGEPLPVALRPVMTLSTRLIAVSQHRRGDRIGYAGTFECPEDMRVGVASCGYGDGYPRHAGTGTPILVNGRRTQVLGRVSMDMLCVDLRGFGDVAPDAEVTLWGEGLPVDDVAAAAGTIPYELLCQVTRRVEFHYLNADG